MTVTGKVRIWHDEEGWGVFESDETPGGCWAHYSHILTPGYRSFQPGQEVIFECEAAVQDGYSFRAIRAWVMDGEREWPGRTIRKPCKLRADNLEPWLRRTHPAHPASLR